MHILWCVVTVEILADYYSQNWGWACEQIVALDVVTAEGELIRVNSKQNSDLLWAAKGAGPGMTPCKP